MSDVEAKRKPITSYGWMYFDLDVNPEPWKVGPLSLGRRHGTKQMYPIVGRDMQLYTYQQAIREQLAEYDTFLLPGMYVAKYCFWRRRDQYTNDKQRQVRKHEIDLTNALKATEDACQGMLFRNDVDCVAHENYFFEQEFDTKPRVVIGVSPVAARPRPSSVMDADLLKALNL